MKIQFLLVPYDSGRREWRMGRGPSYLLRHGVGSSLRALGHEVDAEYVEPGGLEGPNPPASAEIATSFSLYRQVAVRARAARANGALPIVLGGNCGVTLGAIAAATMTGRSDLGVLWLDAHADFNTPETTVSGFLDGMGLAVLTGRCWRRLAERFESFQPVRDSQVIQIGVREKDPPEFQLLQQSGIKQIPTVALAGLPEALKALSTPTVYVHVDLDVIDTSEGRANGWACGGVLSLNQLRDALELIGRSVSIVAGAVTCYDPAVDMDGRIGRAVPRIVELLAH